MKEQPWHVYPTTRTILEQIARYRQRYGIVVGSVHVGGDDLSATGELVEQLARTKEFEAPWGELVDPEVRHQVRIYLRKQLPRRAKRCVTV